MLPRVGDVLGELGQEVQRLEDLEVAADPGEQTVAGRLGETSAATLLSEVEDLAVVGDPDHAGEAERAAQHVLGQTLEPGGVAGSEGDAVVDTEAAVPIPVDGRAILAAGRFDAAGLSG
jgi:hypothetical protein